MIIESSIGALIEFVVAAVATIFIAACAIFAIFLITIVVVGKDTLLDSFWEDDDRKDKEDD